MEFRVLGPLEARGDESVLPLGSAQKLRLVLAALLSRADQPVSLDWLISVVWSDQPPASGRQNLQHYVHQLRTLLGGDRIASHPGGYLIHAGDELDAARFRRLAKEGNAALDDEDAARAADRLRAALNLWRGPAYAEFTDCVALAGEAARLEDLRLSVYENWAQAELTLGRYSAPVSELTDLVRAHPYRESLSGYLMRALYGAGRQADALQLFRSTRALFIEQLGIEPGPQLKRLHQQMLRGDEGLATNAVNGVQGPLTAGADDAIAPPVPRELPADVSGFTGRDDVLKALDELLPSNPKTCVGPVVIAAITGTAGVGKTALAVHWAHRVAEQFPDGQLYLNLRGYAQGRPLRAIEALTALLTGLGMPLVQVPVEVTAAAARYRSYVAGQRILIVLDNAESTAQVRPLLAGSAGCFVLITGRDRLTGLVAHEGARRIELSVLSPDESVELLGELVGYRRIAAEPGAVAELARACAHLPLALRIAGAGLVDQPRRRIADYVAELGARNMVAALTVDGDDDSSVRYAFDLSYRALPESAQRTFRFLGLVPCPDFSVRAVAALAGTTEVHAQRIMTGLVAAHLVEEHSPGRYTTHDLLRQYAAHLAIGEDGLPLRTSAIHRLFDWFTSMSVAASSLLYPEVLRLPAQEDLSIAAPELTGAGPARAWLDAERHNLVIAILHAARHGPREAAWRLADALRAYHDQGRHLTDWLTTSRAALAAARGDGDLRAQAASYQGLAHAHYALSHYRQSVTHLRRALALSNAAGWDEAESAVSANLAIALQMQGNITEAVEHLSHALEIHERIDWPSGHARAMLTMATLYQRLGRLHEGAELAIRAAGVYPSGAALGRASATTTLGELYVLLGRLDEATQLLDSALTTYRAFGSRRNEATCHIWRARVHRDAGRLDQSGGAARAALDLADETGIPELRAEAHLALGLALDALGEHLGAVRSHETALTIAGGINLPHTEGETLLGLAAAHHHAGDQEAAIHHAARALALAQQAGFALLEGRALTILGQVHHHHGDDSRALAHGRRALISHQQTGHRIGEADTHLLLAAVLRQLGDRPSSNHHRKIAQSLYHQIGAPPTTITH